MIPKIIYWMEMADIIPNLNTVWVKVFHLVVPTNIHTNRRTCTQQWLLFPRQLLCSPSVILLYFILCALVSHCFLMCYYV